MTYKTSIGRGVASIILVVVGLFFLGSAYYNWQRLTDMSKAKLVNIEVDFSKPGNYSSSFYVSSAIALGLQLELKFDWPASGKDAALPKLDGLEGKVSVADENGQVVGCSDFTSEDFYPVTYSDEPNGYYMMVHCPFSAKGDFTLTIDIVRPAGALRNSRQILTGRFLICGLQTIPALFLSVAGLTSAGLGVKMMRSKHKKKLDSAPASEGASE